MHGALGGVHSGGLPSRRLVMVKRRRGDFDSIRQKEITPSIFSGEEHAPELEPFRSFYLKLSPADQAKYNALSQREQREWVQRT